MHQHRLTPLLFVPAVAAAVLIAGCSSSGGGSSPTSSAARPSSPSNSASAAAAALADKIDAGLSGLRSAHLAVDAGALGGTFAGDFAFSGGKATGSDIVVGSGSERTRVVTVDGTSYAKLPGGRNVSGKPWVKVSAQSKNEFVRALAATLTLSQAAGSLPAVSELVRTASSVRDEGATAGGHKYALTIDPAKSSGTTLGALLAQTGQKSVPVDLVVDDKGRPVKVQVTAELGGQSFDFAVHISKFDAPVRITAPPPDQVSDQ